MKRIPFWCFLLLLFIGWNPLYSLAVPLVPFQDQVVSLLPTQAPRLIPGSDGFQVLLTVGGQLQLRDSSDSLLWKSDFPLSIVHLHASWNPYILLVEDSNGDFHRLNCVDGVHTPQPGVSPGVRKVLPGPWGWLIVGDRGLQRIPPSAEKTGPLTTISGISQISAGWSRDRLLVAVVADGALQFLESDDQLGLRRISSKPTGNQKLLTILPSEKADSPTILFSQEGRLVMEEWAGSKSSPLLEIPCPAPPELVFGLTSSPERPGGICCLNSQGVTLFSRDTGQILWTWTGRADGSAHPFRAGTRSVPDSSLMLSLQDGSVVILDTGSGQEIQRLKPPNQNPLWPVDASFIGGAGTWVLHGGGSEFRWLKGNPAEIEYLNSTALIPWPQSNGQGPARAFQPTESTSPGTKPMPDIQKSTFLLIGAGILAFAVMFMLFRRGKGRMKPADLKSQEARLSEVLEEHPDQVEVIASRFRLRQQLGLVDEAMEDLRDLVRLQPREPEWLETWLDLQPESFESGDTLLRLYAARSLLEKKTAFFEKKVKSLSPAPIALKRLLAAFYLHLARTADAIVMLRGLLNEEPQHTATLARLADALQTSGETSEAMEIRRQLAMSDRSREGIRYWQMILEQLQQEGRCDEAVETFRLAWELRPDGVKEWKPLLEKQFQMLQKQGARSEILLYGGLLMDIMARERDLESLRGLLSSLLSIAPHDLALQRRWVFLNIDNGETEGLEEKLTRLYQHDPEDGPVRQEYLRHLIRTDRLAEAGEILLDAQHRGLDVTHDAEVYWQESLERVRQGDAGKILKSMQELGERFPAAQRWALLVEARLYTGDPDGALEAVEELLRTGSSSRELLERQKYIRAIRDERNLKFAQASKAGNPVQSITMRVDGQEVVFPPPADETAYNISDPMQLQLAEARLCFQKGEFRKALPIFQEILKQTTGARERLTLKTYLLAGFVKLNIISAALRVLRSLEEDLPQLTTAEGNAFLFKAGNLFEELDDPSGAMEAYGLIVSRDADYLDAAERLEQMRARQESRQQVAGKNSDDSDDDRTAVVQVRTEADSIPSRYEVLSEIGKGGMGRVYRARDTENDREVAIKVPLVSMQDDADMMNRFKREAALHESLHHPNILEILAVSDGEIPWIVMELLNGQSLKDILREKKQLPWKEVREIIVQCCAGLSVPHERRIIHRDIKPENIMIVGNSQVKLMDFGLAKAMDEVSITRAGTVLGTFAYMAPEQCSGSSGDVETRSDIYSLGVVSYELLTGEKPFASGDILQRQLKEKPVSPRKKNSQVPYPVESIVMKCLEKKPVDRYESVTSLRDAWLQIPESAG